MAHRIVALAAALAAGCGSSGSQPDARPGDAPADAHIDAAPVAMSGTVTDGQNPLAQAHVCLVGHPEVACATTAADGTWTLVDVFPEDDVAISYTASGYLGTVSLSSKDGAGVVWLATAPLATDAQATQLLATEAGFAYPDAANGFFRVHVEGVVGATVTLAPAGGGGPVYTRSDGTPDPSLAATASTTSNSLVYFGNLAPGAYTLTAFATGKACYDRPQNSPTPQPIAGDWAPSGVGTIRIAVVAGALTDDMHVYCF
ncbi:MAG: hypothetical protein ACM31C_29655 [Acidobacteriota bacterium]